MWRPNCSVTIPSTAHRPIHPPATINHYNIQLQMIINHQFVVVHTCTRTLFHTQHIREIYRRTHNNKRQNLLNLFWISSVCFKRDHVWRSFLSSPLVLSRLTTAVVVFLSGCGSRYVIQFLIWGCITSILAPNITTRYILSSWICANFPFVLLPA